MPQGVAAELLYMLVVIWVKILCLDKTQTTLQVPPSARVKSSSGLTAILTFAWHHKTK